MFRDGYRTLTDSTQIGVASGADLQICRKSVDRLACFSVRVGSAGRRSRRSDERVASVRRRGGRFYGGAHGVRRCECGGHTGFWARRYGDRRCLARAGRRKQYGRGARRGCASAVVRHTRVILRAWRAQHPDREQRDDHPDCCGQEPAERDRRASHLRGCGARRGRLTSAIHQQGHGRGAVTTARTRHRLAGSFLGDGRVHGDPIRGRLRLPTGERFALRVGATQIEIVCHELTR